MSLNTMKVFRGIDFSDCLTNDDKIKKIINKDKNLFEDLFYELDENEKEKYFYNLKTYLLKKYLSTKSDDFKFNYIINYYKILDDITIKNLTELINDDNLKYEIVALLITNKNGYYIIYIMKNITSDILKMKLINLIIKTNYSSFICTDAIMLLNDDKNKELFIPFLSKYEQTKIIKSFKDVNLIKKYSLKKEYSNYRSNLIAATQDSEFIKKQFIRINVPIFRNNLINLISDEKLKLELISLLDDKNVGRFILSNLDNYYDDYLIDCEGEVIDSEIDDQITIGVELECCNKKINHYKNIKSVLKDFIIKSDGSVRSGFEIVSPILHYTKTDMQKLKSVCNLLKENEFYTDYSCGGHIHIGANYLATVQEMYMLLYLYNNCEHIIYQICNKAHSKSRKNINIYAKTTKNIYLKASKDGMLNENLTNEQMIDTLHKISNSRYKGLNLKNLNNSFKKTIEFRMPNGEIEFTELIFNIKLFTKLVQRAHELANLDMSDKRKIQALHLSDHMPERKRLELFLNILFDSEKDKEIYRERYNSNIVLFESIKNELFYKKEKLIEIDKDSKRLSKKVTKS